MWFNSGMALHAAPSDKPGRQQTFSDAAIQACLAIKVLYSLIVIFASSVETTVATRQTTGFMVSLLKRAGLDWPVPGSSKLCRRQKVLTVHLPYQAWGGLLHLLVDSTRTMIRSEGACHARKHGGARRRVLRKVHLAVDEATMEVRAVEITDGRIGDAPMLPVLLSQISGGEPVASVTAGGACRDAITNQGAGMIIPPRRNAKPWERDGPGVRGRNDDLRAIERFGRTPWRKRSCHHRRSRVETKMNCMKFLGQKLAARDFDRQTAEIQARIAIPNRFTALGIPVIWPIG